MYVRGGRVSVGLGILAVSAAAVVACGSDDDASGGKDSGAADATAHDSGAVSDAGAAPDATTGDAGASDATTDGAVDAAADAAAALAQGQIVLTFGYSTTGPPGSAVVRFVQPGVVGSGCTTMAAAAGCSFTSCPGGTGPDPVYAAADTGEISIHLSTGSDAGFDNAAFLDLAPGDASAGDYVPIDGSIPAYPGRWDLGAFGGPIVTTGAGDPGSLGPFTVQGILPARLHLAAPPLTFIGRGPQGPAAYSTSFPRSQDLSVAYTGGLAGTRARFVLETTAYTAPYATKRLTCDFDGTAGAGTIPSKNGLLLLDDIDVDGGGPTGILSAFGYDESTVSDGDASITQSVTVSEQEAVRFSTTD